MFSYDTMLFPMERLTTPRLILRRMEMRDAQDLYDYGRDEEVARHVLWSAYRSVAEARVYVRYMMRKYRGGEPASWCIELKSTGRVIGTIGYMWHQDEHNSAEIGYSLARDMWNQGIMTEALNAVIDFFFDTVGANRVEARHDINNPNSGAVMRKCGMQYEGTLRQADRNNQGICDTAYYSILITER